MNDQPILSIMMPNYNQKDLILKALESVPKRNDIELIIIDDVSTDGSLEIIRTWVEENKALFYDIILKVNDTNMGCGFGKNWAYSHAQGDYIITLDSDDYLYTDNYNKIIDRLYNTNSDVITIDNDINNGEVWGEKHLNNPFCWRCATWSYFCKRSFLVSHNLNYCSSSRRAGDLKLSKEILKHKPSVEIWNILSYHYNYPRKGSIVWNYEHGKNKS